MINEKILASLDSEDKETLLKTLIDLINMIDKTSEEFRELKESYKNLEKMTNQIVDFLPNAIWVIEEDGHIFLQNSKAKELGELFKVLSPKDEDYEVDFKEHSYLIQTSKSEDRIIISATDITDEKRKERLASMGQISAHLAHEIRNPIGSVALMASALSKKVDEPLKYMVEEIKKSIWRVERIIKATLLFSKGVSLNKKRFNLASLKRELESSISYYPYSKEIEFIYKNLDKEVYADEDLLIIVFQNFMFNAIDAIEEDDNIQKGVIELIFEDKDEFYLFEIYDNGKPIENKAILFEPFKTTKTKGHGLGLALSLQIIQVHNGTIALIESPKKGFEIKIKKEILC